MTAHHKATNDEILAALEAMQHKSDSVVVLDSKEIESLRKILETISIDDLEYMKTYVDDKKAIQRVFGKVKRFALALTAILTAYFIWVQQVWPYLKEFLTSTPPPH